MNYLTIGVLVLVVFCYCGGKYCPAVLKQNKQILLGIVGGLVLASFFGLKLEGAALQVNNKEIGQTCTSDGNCISGNCSPAAPGKYYGHCIEATTESRNRNSESQARNMEHCNNDNLKVALCASMPDQWDGMCTNNPCDSTGR